MPIQFPIDPGLIRALAATRSGRLSIAGFCFQAAYATARLAAMYVQKTILGIPEIPAAIRYDWAEDLDEIDFQGRTVFVQCKKLDRVGEPAQLADILLGFAPKLLWATPDTSPAQILFRLVCPDPRYHAHGPVALESVQAKHAAAVCGAIVHKLTQPLGPKSDAHLWSDAARSFGFERLAESLWNRTHVLYVADQVDPDDPAGPAMWAERQALDLLIRHGKVHATRQRESLALLRTILHNDLVTFDPQSSAPLYIQNGDPATIVRDDVLAALFPLKSERDRIPSFDTIEKYYLAGQRQKEKRSYVARPPEWADVVHGEDSSIGFIERDTTMPLIEAVVNHIIQPLERETDPRLHAICVLGSPGSGKSTLIRRAASQLITSGLVTVADFGNNVAAIDPGEVDLVISDLGRLCEQERPVLVVLDDPFFAESGWDRLIQRLARARLNLGLLIATPTLMFEKFASTLPAGQVLVRQFTLGGPTAAEQASLARIYGRIPTPSHADVSEFLVLAMEMAAGEAFDDIIERIWQTLNDGVSIDPFCRPQDLPWPVQAFLMVCFFHRYYNDCPETLLQEGLRALGSAAPADYRYHLANLKLREGWSIFAVQQEHRLARFQGAALRTAHQRIAREAWRLRPVPAFGVEDWIARASVDARIGRIGRFAGELKASLVPEERRLAGLVAEAWLSADQSLIPTFQISYLASGLARWGADAEALPLKGELVRRALRYDFESWTATVALNMRPYGVNLLSPDCEIDMARIIDSAHFALGPTRTVRFAEMLRGHSPLQRHLLAKIVTEMTNEPHANATSHAVVATIRLMRPNDLDISLVQALQRWLRVHPEDWHLCASLARVITRTIFWESIEDFVALLADILEQRRGTRERIGVIARRVPDLIRRVRSCVSLYRDPASTLRNIERLESISGAWSEGLGKVRDEGGGEARRGAPGQGLKTEIAERGFEMTTNISTADWHAICLSCGLSEVSAFVRKGLDKLGGSNQAAFQRAVELGMGELSAKASWTELGVAMRALGEIGGPVDELLRRASGARINSKPIETLDRLSLSDAANAIWLYWNELPGRHPALQAQLWRLLPNPGTWGTTPSEVGELRFVLMAMRFGTGTDADVRKLVRAVSATLGSGMAPSIGNTNLFGTIWNWVALQYERTALGWDNFARPYADIWFLLRRRLASPRGAWRKKHYLRAWLALVGLGSFVCGGRHEWTDLASGPIIEPVDELVDACLSSSFPMAFFALTAIALVRDESEVFSDSTCRRLFASSLVAVDSGPAEEYLLSKVVGHLISG